VGFINAVMKSNVNFIACDLPIVNSFIIHVFAALAEYERGLISQRTKSALSSLRDRGVKLGSPNNLTTAAAAAGRTAGSETRRRKADTYARKIGPLVTRYRDKGMSLRDIAAQLTADQMLTPGGKGAWTASAVRSVLQRCAV
jgi:DNA invertase Pin-like site-specific DNA recombinase